MTQTQEASDRGSAETFEKHVLTAIEEGLEGECWLRSNIVRKGKDDRDIVAFGQGKELIEKTCSAKLTQRDQMIVLLTTQNQNTKWIEDY
jgi:hypothetical protein